MVEELFFGRQAELPEPIYLAPELPRPARYVVDTVAAGQMWGDAAGHGTDIVFIEPGRAAAAKASFDGYGFTPLHAPTRVRDFHDEEEVLSLYWPEVESLLQAVLGASRAVVFDHALRPPRHGSTGPDAIGRGRGRPGRYVRRSAAQLVRTLLPIEAGRLLRHRFAIVTLWRAVERLPPDPRPFVPGWRDAGLARFGTDWPGLSYLHDHPRSRQPEGALLVGHYDSAREQRPAADDALREAAMPPATPRRAGIEVHALAFWETEDPSGTSLVALTR